MAGPYQNKTGVTPSVEESIGAGLAGVGAAPVTTTTGAPPPVPGIGNPATGFKIDVQNPTWGYQPSQEDFGQADVRRANYDTGLVETARQAYPFPALANRQMGLQARKDALAKKVADFDLYAGIGKAADPYLRSHGELARRDMDRFVDEIAQAYQTDRRGAIEQIATNPELKARWKDRAMQWEEVGQQSQALFKDASDLLLSVEANEAYVDPELQQAARELVSGIGTFGSDGKPDVMKQVELGRRYERLASREKLFQEQVVPGLAHAMQVLHDPGRIDRTNGLIRLTETEQKNFDGLVDQMARRWTAFGLGSYEENKKYLKDRLPTSTVTDTQLREPAGAGSASGKAPARFAYQVSETQLPAGAFKGVMPSGEQPKAALSGRSYLTLSLFDIKSDQGQTPQPRPFNDYDKQTYLHPTRIMKVGDKLFIVGKETGLPRTSATGGGSNPLDILNMGGDEQIQEFKNLPDKLVPYESNEDLISQYFPWLTDAGIREALGATPRKTSSFQTDAQPPVPGAKLINGVWWVEKDGQVVKAQ